jgi:CheY-like chemotaxis protein
VQPDRGGSESWYSIAGFGPTKRSKPEADVVVIVDDDADTRDLIRTLLEDEGYRTAQACNGQEALAVLRQPDFRPALILLDLMMPTMDGFQLRARLRADPALAAIPIVVMTAHGALTRALEQSEPPTIVLRKPLDLDRLLDVVETRRSR